MRGFISRRAGAYHNLVIYGEKLLVVLKYQEVLNGVMVRKVGKAVPATVKDVHPWKRMFQAHNARLLVFQQVYEATLDTPDKREFIQVGYETFPHHSSTPFSLTSACRRSRRVPMRSMASSGVCPSHSGARSSTLHGNMSQ